MCISALNKDFIERKKQFDEIFGTDTLNNIDFDNMKLLNLLVEYFAEDIYRPSPKYEELRKQSIEISNKLEKTFTDEQQEIFEQYWELQNKMLLEEENQLFLFGFLMSKEIEKETTLIPKDKAEN